MCLTYHRNHLSFPLSLHRAQNHLEQSIPSTVPRSLWHVTFKFTWCDRCAPLDRHARSPADRKPAKGFQASSALCPASIGETHNPMGGVLSSKSHSAPESFVFYVNSVGYSMRNAWLPTILLAYLGMRLDGTEYQPSWSPRMALFVIEHADVCCISSQTRSLSINDIFPHQQEPTFITFWGWIGNFGIKNTSKMTFSLKLTPMAAVGLYFTLANAQVNCSVSLAIIKYRTHINPKLRLEAPSSKMAIMPLEHIQHQDPE